MDDSGDPVDHPSVPDMFGELNEGFYSHGPTLAHYQPTSLWRTLRTSDRLVGAELLSIQLPTGTALVLHGPVRTTLGRISVCTNGERLPRIFTLCSTLSNGFQSLPIW